MSYSNRDEEKYEAYLSVHLRSKKDLPDKEKIPELEKKLRNKYIQFIVNLVIIVLFIYAFFNDLTTFGDWFFYLIFGVFAINILLLFVQRRQINELIDYINYRIDRGSG